MMLKECDQLIWQKHAYGTRKSKLEERKNQT